MAKDGTMRGGARVGAGKKPKALHQKINEGSADGALILPQPVELEGADVPPVKEYLKAAQKNGKELLAEEVFNETYLWLKKFGCAELVNTQLINQYAMAVADPMRRGSVRIRVSCQAPHNGQRDIQSLCVHAHPVHETGEPGVDADLPDRERELRRGLRCKSAR